MSNQFYSYLLRLNEYDRKIKLGGTLAVSLNEFQERWSKYAKEFNFLYGDLEININNNVLNIEINGIENIVFLGNIIESSEEKIIKSINMIASGDGNPLSAANILVALGILVACLNPQEDVDFRKNLFNDLGISEIKIGTKSAVIVNDFKYEVNFTRELGFWFSVKRNKRGGDY